jgi:hypothetical protein
MLDLLLVKISKPDWKQFEILAMGRGGGGKCTSSKG